MLKATLCANKSFRRVGPRASVLESFVPCGLVKLIPKSVMTALEC